MEEETAQALIWMQADITASFLALCNALDAKGVLSKHEVAEAAQERLLEVQGRVPPETTGPLTTLRALATVLERSPDR